MRSFVRYLLLTEAFAVVTFGLGWWSVPLVGALWGAASADVHRARNAGVCAALAWLMLLLMNASRGPVATMASQLAAVMHVPVPVMYLATLAFPALLAWSAATLVPQLRKAGRPAATSSI